MIVSASLGVSGGFIMMSGTNCQAWRWRGSPSRRVERLEVLGAEVVDHGLRS